MYAVFSAWGNKYEVEQNGNLVAIYRRIPLREFLDYYTGDTRVEWWGQVRRLFIMFIPLGKAEQLIEEFDGRVLMPCRNMSMKRRWL